LEGSVRDLIEILSYNFLIDTEETHIFFFVRIDAVRTDIRTGQTLPLHPILAKNVMAAATRL
jgi:hypothetical protein